MTSRWEMIPLSDGYKLPQNMPEALVEVRENMKKRPFYCYRIFVNNVDHYISREIAKFFNGEYFLTPDVIKNMQDAPKPKPPEEKPESEGEGKDKKGKKGGRRQSKRQSRSSKSSRKSSAGRRSSKRQSRASKSSRKSTGGKRKSRSSSQKQQRKSQVAGGKRKSQQTPTSRKSVTGKKAGKGKQTGRKVQSIPVDPEEVEKMLEELWPKFRREETKFVKAYDWNADFPFLEDLRLLTKEQLGFDLNRAKLFYAENVEWDEDMKRRMRERAWMYTRCIPPCGGIVDEGGDTVQFLTEFAFQPEAFTPGPGGDSVKKQEAVRNMNYMKPNVVKIVKEYRQHLWKEDGGEKSLHYYNEDLIWGAPTHQVVATRAIPLPEGELPPYYVTETIDNIKSRADYQKNMYPCMIQIYDITKSPDCIEEAKMALDFLIEELKMYSEETRLKNQALFGIHTFIVITPLLTWAETRSLAKQPQDTLREEYFWKRIPHPKYKKHWEFENYVYEKAYECRDLLKIILIGVGLVYGNGDHDLKPYYELARRNITPVLYLGRGYNIVPLIHIEDLVRLCLQLTREWPAYTRYIIAAEKKLRTVREIMDVIAQGIAEGYVSNAPLCFGKAFGIIGEDTHSLLYNEFKLNPTYLHDIKKHGFRHDFGTDIKKTFAQYEKEQGYRPIRIVLFGPSDADQRKIGEALAAHYKVPYINGFRAVKIFLRILLDLQNQVLDSVLPKPPQKTWKLVEGKNEYYQFKTNAPLAWHRENRLLFRRDPKLEEIRDKHRVEVKRTDPTLCRAADLPRTDFFETDSLSKAEPQDPKYQEAKEHLLNFDKLKQGGADLLGALVRVDMQALIVRELLKFPTCKNNGYVLDGLPTSEEEAEIIFGKGEAAAATRPSGRPTSKSIGAFKAGAQQSSPSSPQSPGGFGAKTAAASDSYEYLPSHVFHIKKSESEAFRDLIKGGSNSSFHKDYMAHFRRMQMHRMIMNRIRSALDFFEDKFNMTTYCFDSGATPSDQIIKNIIEMIDVPPSDDLLFRPDSDILVDNAAPTLPDDIKTRLGVYSEDDGPRKEVERTEQLTEPSYVRPLEPTIEPEKVEQEIPLKDRLFTQEEIDEAKTLGEKMVKEVMHLPDRALAYINYLNKFVSKSIIRAAVKAPEANPQDLIDWTAFQLMANNEGGRMPVEKIIPPPEPTNLSEYPFYVDKFDKKYVKHLE